MRYLSVNNEPLIKSGLLVRRMLFATTLLLISYISFAQVPRPQTPPVLVNDFASVFTLLQRQSLESKLVQFAQETSNQIVVVTVNDMGGMDKAQFAFEIGEKWGVGDSKFNNGVVILIQPKRGNIYGEVYIAIGYGLEGTIPDAISKRIVEKEMIPEFRNDDYYQGVENALNVIMPLAKGEYSYEQYSEGDEAAGAVAFLIIFIILTMIFVAAAKRSTNSKNFGSGKRSGFSDFMSGIILGSMSSGSSSGWSGGSSGSSGFGGFGGGSFGGGGAGGRW